jgi:acyl-CoA dehydrogenase
MELALSDTLALLGQHGGKTRSDADLPRHDFALAECRTETTIARVFLDHCITRLLAGTLDTATASMAKYWTTEAQARLLDTCLGVLEAHGFAGSNPIAELYHDARAYRLYGGTTEIMKTIIGRSLRNPG